MAVQKDVGDCCLCIPLRYGVGLLCLYTFVHGLICVLGLFVGDVRMQNGGYNPATNGLQVQVGCLGIIFGVTGILGVVDNKLPWIKYYNYFQYVKLLVAIVVYIADMRELRLCDTWGNNLQSQIAYNAPIDTIALKGLCHWTREAYTLGFMIDFGLQCYFTWVSYIYYERMQQVPPLYIYFEASKNEIGETFFDPDIGEVGGHLGNLHGEKMGDKQKDKFIREHYGSTTAGAVDP